MKFHLGVEFIKARNDGGLVIGIQNKNSKPGVRIWEHWDYCGRPRPLPILSIEVNHLQNISYD